MLIYWRVYPIVWQIVDQHFPYARPVPETPKFRKHTKTCYKSAVEVDHVPADFHVFLYVYWRVDETYILEIGKWSVA